MERSFSHEQYSGLAPEREEDGGEYEQSPETEQTKAELLMEAFESGRRFNDEDEKEREYNARLDQANALQEEADQISEQIMQTTTQLASLPLTYDQQVLLGEIEKLIAQRNSERSSDLQARLDEALERKTKELAALPVTEEQGALLDMILEFIDARDAVGVKLQQVFQGI
ncbi:MAG TPA: hypothetical protein VGE13_00330 [Candidatus Saccharimonadales bacterium]